MESPLTLAQRKSTDIRKAILLAKRASFNKKKDRNSSKGGNSVSDGTGPNGVGGTHTTTIKKEFSSQKSTTQATNSAADSEHTGSTNRSANVARMRDRVPTFSEGEQKQKLPKKQNESTSSGGSPVESATARRLVGNSMSAAAAAVAADSIGPTLAIGGDDDLGPEGAEAGSDDEGEEEIGTGSCTSLGNL